MTERLHVVLPAGVDDPRRPSGGNTYDLRVVAALRALGVEVGRHDVGGTWPRPGPDDEVHLGDTLAAVPDGATVVVDGLVGCAAPDVVTTHAGRLRLALLVHLPLGDETGLSSQDATMLAEREGRAVRAAATVVATSRATAARVETLHGLPAGAVGVAAPGVDPAAATTPSDDGTRLLCVASVTPRKGQDVLLDALARVVRPWRLTLAGPRDPAFSTHLRAVVAERGWQGRVTFTGPLAGADLDAAYAAADLLVLASRAEPYGMVVTEALARAVPVLASDVDGVPEALGTTPDGERPGLLVPAGDPTALEAAVTTWLDDDALRVRLRAAAARRRTALTGWDRTATDLRTALGTAPAGGPDCPAPGPAPARDDGSTA